jgi:two-component system, NtrC family, sensor histidine kinase KinB
MKIKVKLTLFVGLLFAMIVLLTAIAAINITKLADASKNILVANYNTIDYSRQMLIALDEGIEKPDSKKKFEANLQKQKQNVTEVGEQELTDKLTLDYQQLLTSTGDSTLHKIIRKELTDLMLVNMQAIQRKSSIAEKAADSARLWVTLAGTICFLIAFTVLVNIPGNIADPIKELTESIKGIAGKNYSQRVHFEKHNEFGDLANAFNTMAEKLEEYNSSNVSKLMMEKKRIETLINNMHDPVIGLDELKRIIFINNTALKIAGLKSEEAIGKPVQEIAMTNDLIRSLVQSLFGKPSSEKTEPVKIYADNKESYFEKEIIPINIIPTGEKEEKHIGDVILLQNITPFKELDFAKTNFIATVSHELKTPISAIKMSLQLMENEQIGNLNDEQKNLLTGIKDDADRLLKITGELLNMTQVESGNIQLSLLASDLNEIMNEAIGANKIAADQKQIQLKIEVPATLPKVLADHEKTTWVVSNLISNAIRYSYENSVIYVTVSQLYKRVLLSVKDTGQGIAPQYKDKIFDRYFRIPGTQKEGTGLGLSISKEFMEAQGGSITVESDFGAGSTFTIELNQAV